MEFPKTTGNVTVFNFEELTVSVHLLGSASSLKSSSAMSPALLIHA